MISKATVVAITLLTFGFLGGYIAGSLTLQGQLTDLNLEYSNAIKENIQLRETNKNLGEDLLKLQIEKLESNTGHIIYSTHSSPGWYFQGWSTFPLEVPPAQVPMESGNYD
jgi:hypothetical protein